MLAAINRNKVKAEKYVSQAKLKLDEIGTETWLLIDSKKNVVTIAGELEKKFGDRIEPVNQRLTTFLTQLYRQKFISFIEIKE